ncbi:MAG: iron-sulfur cluster assembly scaffold protein [Blastocatellia bacterium]
MPRDAGVARNGLRFTRMYSPQVAEHIANPRNVGELDNPSGVGDVVNEVCMDRIRLTVRVEEGRIKDARVQAQGCPPTVAAASALTELIGGRSLDELQSFTRKDIVDALGRLPAAKMHCASLAVEALRAAIESSRHG